MINHNRTERVQEILFISFVVPVIVAWTIIKWALRLCGRFIFAVLNNAYGKVVAAAGTALLAYLAYLLSSVA